MNKYIRTIFSIVVAIILLLFSVLPAFAIANPDAIVMNTVKVFQNIFASGDMLFIGEYNVDYNATPVPTESSSDAYELELRSVDSLSLIKARGANGYQWRFTSIYFTAAQITADSITWGSAYNIRMSGSPTMFASLVEGTNMVTRPLANADWNVDGATTSKSLLYTYLIQVVQRIETDSGVVLLTTTPTGSYILNTAGSIIVIGGIPGIQNVLPQLFQAITNNTKITLGSIDAKYANESTISNRLGSSLESSFAGIGQFFGISTQMSAGIWIMLFMLTITSIVFLNTGNTTGAIILTIPIAIMGAYLGAIPMALLFTVAIFEVAYMMYFFWLRGT